MIPIDVAIDDYLHTIVRTRPWTKKREEELLEGLSAWLYEQPDPRVALDEIAPALAEQYAAAASLSATERDELLAALDHLYAWSVYADQIDHNPFAAQPA
jgi:hypothetical protein